MADYLVVANQTLGGEQLMAEIRKRIAAGPSFFYVVVPATAPRTSLIEAAAATGEMGNPSAVADLPGREEAARQQANAASQARLSQLIRQIKTEGGQADGDLGTSDPVKAIEAVIHDRPYAEILISTLPTGASRWLRLDVPHRVERAFKLPVTTVTAKA